MEIGKRGNPECIGLTECRDDGEKTRPKTILSMPTIKIDQDKCKGCVLCVDICPHSLICTGSEINNQGYQYAVLIDPDGKCTGCTVCAIVCPDICIEVFK